MQNVLVEENELRFTFLDAYIFRRGYTKTPATHSPKIYLHLPQPTLKVVHPPKIYLNLTFTPPPPTHKNCPPTQNIPPLTHLHNHPPSPTHPKYTSTPQSTNKNCPPNPTQFQILITLLWLEGVGEEDDRILKATKPWRGSLKFT